MKITKYRTTTRKKNIDNVFFKYMTTEKTKHNPIYNKPNTS